jgi:Flp pilus assembly protein TadD
VRSLSKGYEPEAAADPDLALARERIAAGDPVEAIRLLRLSLGRDPRSLPALHALVDAYLKLGDIRAARDTAERAVRLDDNDPRSRALLGDALVALGDREGAEVQYRRSLLLRADPRCSASWATCPPRPRGRARARSSASATTAASTSRWAPRS